MLFTPIITIVPFVLAQPPIEEAEAMPAPQAERDVKFSFGGGYEHGFDGDLDRGGELAISRFAFNLNAQTRLSDTVELALRFGYGFDMYDFSSDAFGGTEPWDDVHTLSAGAIFTLEASQDWTIFGGPVFQFARESDADWGDSFIGGGVVGASYRLSPDLTLGGGVGIVSQIEDSARVFPIIIAEWQINDEFRLTSQAASNASGRSGIELAYAPGGEDGDWEFALGGASEFSRFRLDDDAIAPNGVGENQNTALWFRTSYDMNPNARVSAIFGLSGDGELELEDDDGDRLRAEDYDGAPFLGVFFNVRF